MPNLSSLVSQSSRLVTTNSEVTLTNKTIDSPVITVNGQSGNPRQPLVFDDNGSVTFGNGDSFSIPAGGTAGRPAAPETGELRYNTDTSGLEQYNGTSWVSVVPDDIDLNTLSINGTQVVDSSGNIDTGSVSINGTQVVDSSGTFFGDGSQLTGIETGGGLQSIQYFTSSGTWIKPSGITKIRVTVIGGGGSGAVSDRNVTGGGGAGAAIKFIDVSSVSSVSVTVGAGGTQISFSGEFESDGNDGGQSSFGSYCSATGGTGGTTAQDTQLSSLPTPGSGTGGDINITGQHGSQSLLTGVNNTYDEYHAPGQGGGSLLGTGGQFNNISYNGNDGTGYGSGGSGASSMGLSSATKSGAGADGIVIIEEYK